MTLRVTFGVDPGLGGAIATIIDAEPGPFLDMPTRSATKTTGREEVDEIELAHWVRTVARAHPGAYFSACIERVRAMPAEGRKQGGSSMFNFGESAGVVRAVFGTLRIPYVRVEAAQWKRHFALIDAPKDAARELALLRFPSMAAALKRKKDCGRADAQLIALWHDSTDSGARAA
jgi:hypothetical protein